MSLKSGYKQTEIEVIPDDWQTKTLGSLLDYEQPTPFLVISTDYLEFSSVPVLTAGKTFILGYTDEEHGVYKSLPVILFDDFTTACQWVDFPFKVKSSAAKILSGRVGVSDTKFMHEYLSRLSYVPSDHQRHWISVFSSIEVIVPPIKEQKAIAEALSDVDALIDSLEALLTKKRNIKTGVMQELLTGRTRLPGFSEDWKEVRLGDHFEITSSKRVFQSDWRSVGVPFYRTRELAVLGETGAVENDLFIDRELFEKHKILHGAPAEGDFLVTAVGTLGKTYVVREGDEFYFKDGNIIWFKASKTIDSLFLKFLFESPFVQNQINGESSGTTVGTYTITNAKRTIIPKLPLDEQHAIAAVLSDIDYEIEALRKRLAKTRDLKQGMAQELLTGRTRLV